MIGSATTGAVAAEGERFETIPAPDTMIRSGADLGLSTMGSA
jgi:hypothetical protein